MTALRAQPQPDRPDDPLPGEEVGGIWAFAGGELVSLAPSDAGDATVLVPSEHVLLMTVELPLASRRARASALPFALEDRIADPIGEVHLALGEELASKTHLAGVVRHGVVAGWVAALEEAGLVHARLVPDCLALSVPEEGGWRVEHRDGRVLVRTADGAGFAAPVTALPALWHAGGRPLVTLAGDALPDSIPAIREDVELAPMTERLMVPALDLRQGLYSPPRRRVPLGMRKVLAVLAAGALAHAAIAAADTLALKGIAADKRAEANVLLQQYAPGSTLGDGVAAEIGTLVSSGGQRPGSRFFPLLARSTGAITGANSGQLQGLAYSERDRALTLRMGADVVAIQRAQGALAAAGLSPVATGGPASEIVIRDGGAR